MRSYSSTMIKMHCKYNSRCKGQVQSVVCTKTRHIKIRQTQMIILVLQRIAHELQIYPRKESNKKETLQISLCECCNLASACSFLSQSNNSSLSFIYKAQCTRLQFHKCFQVQSNHCLKIVYKEQQKERHVCFVEAQVESSSFAMACQVNSFLDWE